LQDTKKQFLQSRDLDPNCKQHDSRWAHKIMFPSFISDKILFISSAIFFNDTKYRPYLQLQPSIEWADLRTWRLLTEDLRSFTTILT
jgi:hypothetical protein